MTDRRTPDNRTASLETIVSVESAAVSDRGLSEKRPVNEDSFLADTERRIFAVADGVGGAESGEVASQTAVETLDEAFRHHNAGEDAEDLMEIAFQRANLAIHQMSREHSKLSMMATTIVALHLDGTRATIGHVGDSRLYCLTADGELRRETADHSVVEEEVRAGRLTADEAQHHPSRNVISRALGAEPNVEADMRTIEISPGSLFLLCSDGITRHIPDEELRDLLSAEPDLHRVCEELKRRCYERGAEDNLTAIIVRVGGRGNQGSFETTRLDEQTVMTKRPSAYATGELSQAFTDFSTPQRRDGAVSQGTAPLPDENLLSLPQPPASSGSTRIEVPTERATDEKVSEKQTEDSSAAAPADTNAARISPSRAKLLIFPLLFFVLTAGALAFYFYNDRSLKLTTLSDTVPLAQSSAVPNPSPSVASPSELPSAHEPTYIEQREAVDEAPQIMMQQMWSERNGVPLEHTDPKFLYLYGRALFRMGNDRDARAAFRRTLDVMRLRLGRGETTDEGAKMGEVETQLRTADTPSLQRASEMLDQMIEQTGGAAQTQSPSGN